MKKNTSVQQVHATIIDFVLTNEIFHQYIFVNPPSTSNVSIKASLPNMLVCLWLIVILPHFYTVQILIKKTLIMFPNICFQRDFLSRFPGFFFGPLVSYQNSRRFLKSPRCIYTFLKFVIGPAFLREQLVLSVPISQLETHS